MIRQSIFKSFAANSIVLICLLSTPIHLKATPTKEEYTRTFETALAEIELGNLENVPVILSEFKKRKLSEKHRRQALEVMASYDTRAFADIFETALSDNWNIQPIAARALCRIENEKGRQWFVRRADPNLMVIPGKSVLKTIVDMNITETIPSLRRWLDYSPPNDLHPMEMKVKHTEVAIALARMGDEEGKVFLRDLLWNYDKNSFGYTGNSALVLAEIGDSNSIPAMQHALGDKTKRDQLRIAEALFILGDDTALPLLLSYMETDDAWAIQSAQLIIKFRVTQAVPQLEQLFEREMNKKDDLRDYWINYGPLLQTEPQTNADLETRVQYSYKNRFWQRVMLACGLVELGSPTGKQGIIQILEIPQDASNDGASWELLMQTSSKHKMIEVVPYVLEYLDLPRNHTTRSEVLQCLRELSNLNLPPNRSEWEQWYEQLPRDTNGIPVLPEDH